MKKHQDSSVRRLPGPAIWPLCEGDQTPEAHHELFRDWQRTQTQSSAKAPRSPRQQMDVWFCGEQEPPAERHTCATANPDLIDCALSQARQGHPCFSIDFDLHRCGQTRVSVHSATAPRRVRSSCANMCCPSVCSSLCQPP